MEQRRILLVLGFTAVLIVLISLLVIMTSTGSGPVFMQENPKNAELICDIIGHTDAVEARFNTSKPLPEYITEKYGTIYIPPEVMTCDLVEIHDLGLKRDNSTTLPTRIYDAVYDLNYIFLETRVQKNNISVDDYSSLIYYINDSEMAAAALFVARYNDESDLSFYQLEFVFQSEFGDEFGIHIMPVQSTESAMGSAEPLYIVYSSKDVDHDYRIPLPDL